MNGERDYLRNSGWRICLVGLLAVAALGFHQPIREMVELWSTKSDYSHGFFVLPFALYLLWTRRAMLPRNVEWPEWQGVAWIAAGAALSFAGSTTNYAKELAQGVGLILVLAGIVRMMFGPFGLRWAWPGLAFLIFMVKMPDSFEVKFALKLRQFAAEASNVVLQTLGFPSYVGGRHGTVITVNDLPLGVEWACSGLSMVLTFAAVAAGFALLVQRPLLDRVLILLSAVPIAIFANVVRITATALVYIAGWKQVGDAIIHDLAGWLMMPLALGLIWLELKVLDWLFTTPAPPERDNIIREATQTAAADWQMPPGGPGAKR